MAKRLGQTGRAAVAEYLQVLTGGDARAKKVNLRFKEIHPHVAKSLDIIKVSSTLRGNLFTLFFTYTSHK